MKKTKYVNAVLALVLVIGIAGLLTSNSQITATTTQSVTVTQLEQPQVVMECLDPTLEKYSAMWVKEVNRRFNHAVVILAHGGDFVAGHWIIATDPTYAHVEPVEDVVRRYQARWPGRTIVMLSCNTGHVKLNVPGVWYFKNSVWCVPDRSVEDYQTSTEERETTLDGKRFESRWDSDPDANGNVFEAVTEGV